MADELDHYRQLLMDDRRETHALAAEARAALAEPEPEGPTPQPVDGEVAELVAWLRRVAAEVEAEDYATVYSFHLPTRAADLLECLSTPQPS